MAKSDTTQPEAKSQATNSPAMTLHEFCTRLSETEKRVELLGAFEAKERKAGRNKATAEVYAASFAAFINKPA